MNNLFRWLSMVVLFLIFITFGFYLWASSPNYSIKEYSKIYHNNNSQKTKNDSVFSIVTYNIGYLSGLTNNTSTKNQKSFFDKNLQLVLDQFKIIDADILAFQEIDYASKRSFNVNQQNEIAKLGYDYIGQAINWDKKYLPFPEFPISSHFGRVLSGQSILSKYKIANQDRFELERDKSNPFYYDAFYIDRLAQVVKINIKDKTLVLINVHIESYNQDTRLKQTKKVIEIFNRYKNVYPTILLGDFNSDIKFKNATIDLLLNVPELGNAVFDKNNYPKTYISENPTERLDYIFYNKNYITFIDGEVLNDFKQASDHLPLLMKFKFKQKNGKSYNAKLANIKL